MILFNYLKKQWSGLTAFPVAIYLILLPCSLAAQETPDTTAVHADSVVADTAQPASEQDTVAIDIEADTLIIEADTAATQAQGRQEELSEIRELISFSKIFLTILLLLLTWFVNNLVNRILENLSEKATGYRLFIKRLTPISRIFIWSVAIYIIIAGVIDPPFETVITIAASIGIAVGFASQDILRNIFGGIMIILDRPFQVGDKIEVGEHYGEVLSIGLRSSRIVTPDDSVVSIPNGELMNRSVSNANSSALDCQVVSEIFLPADTDIETVKEIALKAVYSSPYTYLNKPVSIIVLNEYNQRKFLVKLRVKAYVLDIRYEFFFKSDVTEMILKECKERGFLNENLKLEDQ